MRIILMLSSISGFLAVAFGAFGAHALRARLEPRMLEVFETAVRYHFYHTFALFVVVLLSHWVQHRLLPISAVLFLLGIFIFSGSLYALALLNLPKLGMITPIGGLCLLLAWLLLTMAIGRGAMTL